jgi:SAM-dependent methyltransferase
VKVLDIGCGKSDLKLLDYPNAEFIRLDKEEHLHPDIICNIGKDRIPLDDDSVDIVTAIHCLEHIGKQGETKEWFYAMEEIYRILKPDGLLHFESPLYNSVWAWSDPEHTRAISPQSFVFFAQENYRIQDSRISPFRVKCDFIPVGFETYPDGNAEIAAIERVSHLRGDLKAIKPLKVWWENA